jgi:divalent metal cation (Fe/Co/Zn/Cd) transporter
VDGSITVRDGHAIADEVENHIMTEIPEILEIVIHVDPQDAAGIDAEDTPQRTGAACP